MDRQTGCSAALSRHRLGDGQMDRQTGHSTALSGHRLGDRRTDRPLCVGVAGRTDSRSPSGVLPAAHRLPAGSILWKMLP